MKVQNNVNLNTKSPNFSATKVEVLTHGLEELDKVVRRDLVGIAEGAKDSLLGIKGVDSFQVGRHIEVITALDVIGGITPVYHSIIPTEDIAVTATKVLTGPKNPRTGFWAPLLRLVDVALYPRLTQAVRRVPGANATVDELRKAGAEAAAEIA